MDNGTEHLREKYGMDRSNDDIRCKSKSTSPECQNWIYSRELVSTKLSGDRKLEEDKYQLIKTYCKREGSKDSYGLLQPDDTLCFQDTEMFLGQQLK